MLTTARSGPFVLMICVFIAVSFGGPALAATPYDVLLAARTFQSLAALDPAAAGEAWMTTDADEQWLQATEDAFSNPMHASAFFEAMLWLPNAGPRGTWLIGLFNPWVDGMLVLQFDEAVSQIISFRLYLLSSPGIVSATAKDLQRSVHDRFAAAISAFDDASSAWNAARDQPGWSELKERLEGYESDMRSLLAEDGEAAYAHARDALKAAREGLAQMDASPEIENIEALSPVWRQTAIPVWASEDSTGSFNVVLSSSDDPFWLLWLRSDARSNDDLLKGAVLIDILKSFETNEGGGA